jgi:hypothetical protein
MSSHSKYLIILIIPQTDNLWDPAAQSWVGPQLSIGVCLKLGIFEVGTAQTDGYKHIFQKTTFL